ncbi:hypothetical protein CVT26_004109 [Gymnopilus dilepis]|uniref:Uncharacterized protein n=1 Tax=Gymnopilus dilepis TaxID=231916 RepID=A0A409WYC7_9AGAR|nr:hypothetical protein CVT26_004109 [Gymnopilus dilepis]
MRGLPSYEEAVSGSRGGNAESSSAADANAGAGTTGSTAPAPAPGSSQAPGHASLSRSEPDIAGRFARVRIMEPVSPHTGAQARGVGGEAPRGRGHDGEENVEEGGDGEEGDEDEEDEEEDEGIQMRARSPRS